MLRLLIVDDEPLARRALRQLLDLRSDVDVLAECANVASCEPWLSQADGILLDIEMPGTSGLDFARQRANHPLPALVFVTAFDRYAVPAFATDVLDYLCKPVTVTQLDRAITRMKEHVHRHAVPSAPTAGTEPAADDAERYLIARTGRTVERIAVADVDCLEADDVYAAVYAGAKRWLVRQPLATLLPTLPPDFQRVHRSWIVQRRAVRAIRRSRAGMELVLHSGRVVPVSRRSAKHVRQWLTSSTR